MNKVGNLTLLAQSLNILASNNPFKKTKIEEYIKSNITLTKSIAKYNDFKFTEIEVRSKRLAESAVTIWKL